MARKRWTASRHRAHSAPMKKTLFGTVLLSAILSFSLTSRAENTNLISLDISTNTPVLTGAGAELIQFLGTASNIMVAPYGTYSSEGKGGGGIALAYEVGNFIAPMLRFDYLDKEITMPSASVQLPAPITIAGKLTVIPFGFTGVATPLSGKGNDNGSVQGIFGAGLAVRVTSHLDIVFDVEKWTGFTGQQYRGGILYRF